MKRLLLLITFACLFSGCGAKFGPGEHGWFKIPDGLDFHVGVNNIDTVNNQKGLHLSSQQKERN